MRSHSYGLRASTALKSFPNKYLIVAIIASTYPFPPIAGDGSLITTVGNQSAAQNLPLLTLANEKFPGRLIIQTNSLYPERDCSDRNRSIGTVFGNHGRISNQLGLWSGGGAGCGARGDASPTQCTAATFLQMLEIGIYPLGRSHGLRAAYVEVFATNVNAVRSATLQAHTELVPSNYQGLWWAAPGGSESGCGINFAHEGDVIFATWFNVVAEQVASVRLQQRYAGDATRHRTYQGRFRPRSDDAIESHAGALRYASGNRVDLH